MGSQRLPLPSNSLQHVQRVRSAFEASSTPVSEATYPSPLSPDCSRSTAKGITFHVHVDDDTAAASADRSTRAKVDLLFDSFCWLMGKVIALQGGETPESVDRMKRIRDTFVQEPGGAELGRLLEDLIAMDEQKKRYRDLAQKLVGRQDFLKEASFPGLPSPAHLDREWKAMRRGIVDAIGFGPDSSGPSPFNVGYLAARIDDLVDGKVQEVEISKWVRGLMAHLDSPHSVQLLLSSLLCKWVFLTPEPMCTEQDTIKTVLLYKQIRDTGM